MSAARDQTIKVIADLEYETFDGIAAIDIEEWADKIIEVWKPLLEGLVLAYEHAVEYGHAKGHRLDLDNPFTWGAYKRVKEALA